MKIRLFILIFLVFSVSSAFATPLCIQTVPKYIADKYMDTYKYVEKTIELDRNGNEFLIISYMNPDRYQDFAWAYYSIVKSVKGMSECILERFDLYDTVSHSRVTVWFRGSKEPI